MLKNENRLRKSEDFQNVIQHGKSVANRQFVLYLLPKEGQESIRIGISVSKKLGNAVTRNRVKRLIREAVRHYLSHMEWKGDMILIARKPLTEMEYQPLLESLGHCLRKGKLLTAAAAARAEEESS